MHRLFRGDGDESHGRSGVFRDGFLFLMHGSSSCYCIIVALHSLLFQ
jgi:hypothetical protein